jgi:hypothetical protein
MSISLPWVFVSPEKRSSGSLGHTIRKKTPGSDGFTSLFYKTTWLVIKADVMNTFHAHWSFDGRSFHLINYALLIVLKENKLGIGNQGLPTDKTNQQLLGSFFSKDLQHSSL